MYIRNMKQRNTKTNHNTEQKNTIKDIPIQDRPYEKCLEFGPEHLTDAELLAVILRTGRPGSNSLELSYEILKLAQTSGEGLCGLHHLCIQELMSIPGVGTVKAIQLKCIGELSRRMARQKAKERLSFNAPDTIAEYYMEELRHLEQEVLLCMMLDTKNHLLGEKRMFLGTVNASLVSPRELFLEALRYQAVNIILVHNHPSGDPTPSREDVLITQRVHQGGELIGIHLLDHIIIGEHTYMSFREKESL